MAFKYTFFAAFVASALILKSALVNGEHHKIFFDNRCGFGTPIFIVDDLSMAPEGAVTFNEPIMSAVAFLQTGGCGDAGEGCTLLRTNLTNTPPRSGTSISVSSPFAFSVVTGFGYFNGGCDGLGFDCTDSDCALDSFVGCPNDDVDIAITFCD